MTTGVPTTEPAYDESRVLLAEAKKPLPQVGRDRRLARALRQNHGLVTRGQLERIGFTNNEIFGFGARRELLRLHRGVFADARAPLSDHAYLAGACLALGGRGWLSGRAAAMGWALVPLSVPRIEVTVVAASTPGQRPGLRVRSVRMSPHRSEIQTRNGLRVSSIPRLLIEVAATGGSRLELDRLIEAAIRKDLLDIAELEATLERHTGGRGVGRLRQACHGYLPHDGRRSGLERSFDRWLTKHSEIPEPQRNVSVGPWEIDCYWPDQHLALELDGRPYHIVVQEIERDRRKDAWLQINGIRILRVTDSRWRGDKPGVHDDLLAMLALADQHKQAAGALIWPRER
jgi:hypothetical protein